MPPHHYLQVLLLVLSGAATITAQRRFDYPSANLSTLWTNDRSHLKDVGFTDGSTVRVLLLCGAPVGGYDGPSYALGFYCSSQPCSAFLLAIFIVYTNSGSMITTTYISFPHVVWSANRDRLVAEGATLELTAGGDLVLRDVDDSTVWSTGTSNRSVVSLNLTNAGNIVLVDKGGAAVWSSYDHPTDSILNGQSLRQGQRLVANVAASNWTQGQLYMSILDDGIHAFVDSDPPQLYYNFTVSGTKVLNRSTYITFKKGSLDLFALFATPGSSDKIIQVPTSSNLSVQYMRLESDGHLRLYEWRRDGWTMLLDVFRIDLDDCAYPTVCGHYGICSKGQCSCPGGGANVAPTFFKQVDDSQVNLGCSLVTPLSCGSMQDNQLIALTNVSYFNFVDIAAKVPGLNDEESCKKACLSNCSCKAALFQHQGNASAGSCHLPSQLFSLMDNQQKITLSNSIVFIKVAKLPSSPGKKSVSIAVVLGSVIGATSVVFLIAIAALLFCRRRKVTELEDLDEEENGQFKNMLGMATRFSFEELKLATDDFRRKLGEGGFGSVFEGSLPDGVKVAVKRLDGIGQGKKEFLAEVETIGSIHHIHLVRLVGYCAEKSHRLLVYEHMSNGSLDKWIFYGHRNLALDWQIRYKIIMHIAKGLAYLHEECRQKIVHLDIKPQNILLDEKFDAKVSDFGLSKLIDRDQSQVVTRMRGTPGYLAPEWLSSAITEKVDVYSFGVVVLEIVCGRKNLDYSQPADSIHLALLLESITEEDRLLDMVDGHSTDMQLHKIEAVRMIKLAMRCLDSDLNRRPSMSAVVEALEGSLDLESDVDQHEFSSPDPVISFRAIDSDALSIPSGSSSSGTRYYSAFSGQVNQ